MHTLFFCLTDLISLSCHIYSDDSSIRYAVHIYLKNWIWEKKKKCYTVASGDYIKMLQNICWNDSRICLQYLFCNHGQNIWDTLVFMWNSALQEKFNFYFSGVFC